MSDFIRAGLETLGKNYRDSDIIPQDGMHTCLIVTRGEIDGVMEMFFSNGAPVLTYCQQSDSSPSTKNKFPASWSIAKQNPNQTYLSYMVGYNADCRLHYFQEKDEWGQPISSIEPIADLDTLGYDIHERRPESLNSQVDRLVRQRRENRFYGNETGTTAASREREIRVTAEKVEKILEDAKKIRNSALDGSFDFFQITARHLYIGFKILGYRFSLYRPGNASLREISRKSFEAIKQSPKRSRIFSNPLIDFVL
jgi:hypothetical protein